MAVTVDGSEIPEHEIQAEMARLRSEYGDYVRRQGGEPDEQQLREWAVEDLIEEALFRKEAAATQPAPSDERVRQELEANAATYENVPEAERAGRARVVLQQRRLMREIRKKVPKPDDAALRAYYAATPGLFQASEALKLSHICRVADSASRPQVFLDLLRVKADVEAGRITWVEAVEAFSDTADRDNGMFATVGRGELPTDIEEQLFALKPGALSDVVDFKGMALHLFKLLARLDPAPIAFDTVKEDLRDALFEQACQDALNDRFDALRAAAVIVQP
jgi:parvulin-like peptidyl-prolyl isomerase